MNLFGYARVSGPKQSVEAQVEKLEAAGCFRTWTETVSTRKRMPEREKMLEQARPGDVIVVTKLDRLGRTFNDVLVTMEAMERRGIELRVLGGSMPIDTTTALGKAMFRMRLVFQELERDMITERTQEGRQRAIAAGKQMGRPAKLTADQADVARRLIATGMPLSDVAHRVGVHTTTLSRHGVTARSA
ncbi:MAG TPA: recombinase family protein [Solirubrobacteraceae bacterium]